MENMRLFGKLADRTGYIGRTTKISIIGGDLNLPYADWNGHVEKCRGAQVFLNRLVWENGYTQIVNSPTRGDALLVVYLFRPEGAFTSCSNVQEVSDYCGVLLEVGWGENCREHQAESLVPVYHKTNVTGLQIFLRSKFASWASNGSCVEEIWKCFKEIIFESIERFVPNKILRKNSDSKYYNKDVKRLKVRVRSTYNKIKLGQRYQVELKRLSKELPAEKKKNAHYTFLRSVLRNEGNCWSEFCKYVKRRKGNREIIPAIKTTRSLQTLLKKLSP
jgi:hypothetical protein